MRRPSSCTRERKGGESSAEKHIVRDSAGKNVKLQIGDGEKNTKRAAAVRGLAIWTTMATRVAYSSMIPMTCSSVVRRQYIE
jgi:hypothetical protein